MTPRGLFAARYLSGFRCEVLYYDVSELMVGRDGELDAEAVSFEELLERSDIVRLPPLPAGPRQTCCSGGPACREVRSETGRQRADDLHPSLTTL